MRQEDVFFVSGGHGLVGSAIIRALQSKGFTSIIAPTSTDLDQRKQQAVRDFMERERPAFVFLAAGRVGGIHANNSYPADFIRDNLQIAVNVIDAAYRSGVDKLLFLGSSCIYPKDAPQPMSEDCLLNGPLEPTNEWYAVAKIAGVKMCQAYRKQYGFNAVSAMPTNLYGPGDNFDLKTSHVIPALMRKFYEATLAGAPEVTVWGTGRPRREFLHVDDLANACMHIMKHYEEEGPVNVGFGEDIPIGELARLIAEVVGFKGKILFDHTKPDGVHQKLLDTSKIQDLGWRPGISLKDGLRDVFQWYRRETAAPNCAIRV